MPEYDFGPVLAGMKDLRHDFVLSNPTNRPIRLLKAEARVPCCSSIGPMPGPIAPGAWAKIPITFKTGFETGRRRVEFTIVTDARPRPIRTLGVSARFFAEFEIQQEGGSFLPAGEPGEQTLRAICRRSATEGRRAPVEIGLRPPLEGRVGPVVEGREDGFDGVVRYIREVVVRLPAVDRPGPQRHDILLRWDDGKTSPYGVAWTVTAPIRAVPPAFVVKSSEGPAKRTVRLTAEDRAFRVRQVSGPVLAGPLKVPSETRLQHQLTLAIDPRRLPEGGVSDVRITTDHPHQREVTVSIHISAHE